LASAQFEEFIQQFPSSAFLQDAYLGAGECYFFLKEYDKAVDQFQKYLAQFPDGKNKGVAQVRLAQSLYIKGNLDESLKQLNEANLDSLAPQFKQTLYFFKGQILATQNNNADALANLQLAAETTDAQAYTAQAYFKWGTLLVHTDQAGALDKYSKAFGAADTNDLKASISMKQGEAFYLLKQYDEAAETFRKTLDTYSGLPVIPDAFANWYTVLIAQKKYDHLIADFNQELKGAIDKPEYFAAYLLVAKALAASGNTDGAIALLDKIAALPGLTDEQKGMMSLQKARFLVDGGKFADAAAFIDGQINTATSVKALLLLLKGKSHLNLKEYDKAWATYEQVSKDFMGSPVMAEAICGMAYVRYGQEQFEPAANLFMDCFNKAQEEKLRKDAIYNGFITYRKFGNEDKTVEVAEQYLKLTPAGEHQADVALALSGIYSKRQQFDKANELLLPFLNDPDETKRRNAVFQTAYNLQLSGKADDALASYEKFIADGKNDRLTYLAFKNSAMIYLQKKDDDKAAEVMSKAVQSFADNDFSLKTYLWLVEHWQSKGDAQKMLDTLVIAGKIHEKDPGAVAIKFFAGQAYRMQDNCKQAIEYYDLVVADNDQGSVYKGRSRLGKGVCLTGLGDYKGAKKELEQAVVDSPDDAFVAMRARFALAHNAEFLKDFDMAAKLYLIVDVLYNDPEYAPKSLLRAAAILEGQLNNKKEAVSAYNKIVQAYPNSPEAARAQEKIAQLK
jgi:tetratricopeptide (TPR) repeat protein